MCPKSRAARSGREVGWWRRDDERRMLSHASDQLASWRISEPLGICRETLKPSRSVRSIHRKRKEERLPHINLRIWSDFDGVHRYHSDTVEERKYWKAEAALCIRFSSQTAAQYDRFGPLLALLASITPVLLEVNSANSRSSRSKSHQQTSNSTYSCPFPDQYHSARFDSAGSTTFPSSHRIYSIVQSAVLLAADAHSRNGTKCYTGRRESVATTLQSAIQNIHRALDDTPHNRRCDLLCWSPHCMVKTAAKTPDNSAAPTAELFLSRSPLQCSERISTAAKTAVARWSSREAPSLHGFAADFVGSTVPPSESLRPKAPALRSIHRRNIYSNSTRFAYLRYTTA